MGKKKNRQLHLMKEWHDGCDISYDDLLYPLKKIIHDGYKVERKLTHTQFNYTGYNIGDKEKLYYPTPIERFSSRWLENEAKFNRTLLDNVLITALQLGIEHGRRLTNAQKNSKVILEDIIKCRTNTIRQLRAALAQYEYKYIDDLADLPTKQLDEDCNIEPEFDDVDVYSAKEDKL